MSIIHLFDKITLSNIGQMPAFDIAVRPLGKKRQMAYGVTMSVDYGFPAIYEQVKIL